MRKVKGPYRFSLRHQLAYGLGHMGFILQQEKFVQFDCLRAVVFQLNLKYLHVKITNLFLGGIVRDIWHKYHSRYIKIASNFTCLTALLITSDNFEISLVVFHTT